MSRLVSNLLLALASVATTVVVCLLLLEVFLRLTGATPFFYHLDPEVCAIHIPGLTGRVKKPEYTVDVAFNQAGYRDVERTLAKPAGVRRVALLGDSFMEALQVAFDDTMARRLEQNLRARLHSPGVEVLNFGSAGFGTTCEYLTLQHRALAYHPDLVVLAFYSGNDVYDNHPDLAVEPNQPFFLLQPDGSLVLRPMVIRDNPVKRWLRAHSRAYSWLRDSAKRLEHVRRLGIELGVLQKAATPDERTEKAASRHVSSIYRKPTPLIDAAWAATDAMLARMATELRAQGIPLLVAYIPTAEQFDAQAGRDHLAALGGGNLADFDFDAPWRRMKALLESRGIPWVDLREASIRSGIPVSQLYFADDGHWTAAGHRVAADALTEPVARLLAPPVS
jgi:hypothetical protein